MSKATYHVPQPGDNITFITDGGCLIKCTVARWDSKHGIVFDSVGFRYNIRDRSSIKLAETEKEESHAEPGDELHWVDSSTGEPATVAAAFTTRLPTSFASEVERAQAIADAEAEEKRRSEASSAEFERLTNELERVKRELGELSESDRNADEDHQHRIDYLRSLRVRGE